MRSQPMMKIMRLRSPRILRLWCMKNSAAWLSWLCERRLWRWEVICPMGEEAGMMWES